MHDLLDATVLHHHSDVVEHSTRAHVQHARGGNDSVAPVDGVRATQWQQAQQGQREDTEGRHGFSPDGMLVA